MMDVVLGPIPDEFGRRIEDTHPGTFELPDYSTIYYYEEELSNAVREFVNHAEANHITV